MFQSQSLQLASVLFISATLFLFWIFKRQTRSERLATAHRILEAYNSLSVEAILAPLSDERFTHQVLPASLGMPARGKAAFSKHATGITSAFTSFKMEPVIMYEDALKNAIVVHAKMLGTLAGGKGLWENECIMVMQFDGTGRKIVQLSEFVDSAKAIEMRAKMQPKDF